MNTNDSRPLVIAVVLILVLFLLFGSGAMTGGMMNGGMHNGYSENGWMSNRSWMWFPTIITLGIGVVIGWLLFKKKQ